MQVNQQKKLIGILGLCVGIGIIVVGNVLWGKWIENGPTQPDETLGIIYPYNHRGRVIYLDLDQLIIYRGLPVIGVSLGGILWFVSKRFLDSKEKKK